MNISPWIFSLTDKFASESFSSNIETDVAVVGGGISGALSAYYILKNTSKDVCLIDAGDFGFAATGHNAGYMVAAFDSTIQDTIKIFGEELTRKGYLEIFSGWKLFRELKEVIDISGYFDEVFGMTGYVDIDSLNFALLEHDVQMRLGLDQDLSFFVTSDHLQQIPVEFHKYLFLVTEEEIKKEFDVINKIHIGYSLLSPVAVMNSCQFVQDLLKYLHVNFQSRIKFFSHSPVISIDDSSACELEINNFKLKSEFVVLCTNAFRLPKIKGEIPEFERIVNYQTGYKVEKDIIPKTYFYIRHQRDLQLEYDYVYGSRRRFMGKYLDVFGSTIDKLLEPKERYSYEDEIDPKIEKEVIEESKKYIFEVNLSEPEFAWQGAMAYTKNSMRIVGARKEHPKIIFNIGCNGIGIIPAFFSGDKVARLINGEKFERSLFDAE